MGIDKPEKDDIIVCVSKKGYKSIGEGEQSGKQICKFR